MRYLVVIDHTLGGMGLTWAVREHALEESDIQVDVIVPAEQSETDAAQGRLDMELQTLGAEGIAANGSVVQTDPYEGIGAAAGRQHYDGIIIATHSPTISRWMHLDLPRRVERELQIPVEWIDAHTDDPSEEAQINIDLPRAAIRNEGPRGLT
jgi:hypothetical protein